MNGDWLWRLPKGVELLLILLTGGLLGYVEVGIISFEVNPTSTNRFSKLRRLLELIPRPFFAFWFALGAGLAIWTTTFYMFRSIHLWFPWLIVAVVQIPLAFGWALLFKTVKAHLETQFLARTLSVYVSPARVRQIMNEPDLLKPGGVKRHVSVLFSDIAGFSKHCELNRWEPDEILRQLNGYYESAIGCIYQTEGTVMDLVGDAIFALWNAPQDQSDHQARACRSAVLLHKNLVRFDEKQDLPWRTRIGLHTGEVCIGNIGSQSRFDYTAVGETINLASRLEGLNKQLGTNILATNLMEKAFGAGFVSRRVGIFRFKGFNQTVQVHEILDEGEQTEDAKAWLATFEQGLRMFVRSKFNDAKSAFNETIARRGEDGPSSFYLKILERDFRPPEGWLGEIDLSEK
jgi:adenylate cyclase